MKSLLLLIPLFLTSCAGVGSPGAFLAGTNAEELEASGNVKTGEWKIEVKGLNQSDSFGKAADVVRIVKQTEAATEVATATVSEAGSVTEFLAD